MISKYKKSNMKNILLGAIIVVILGGIGIALNTSKSKETNAKKVAEEFIRDIYTVDAKKITDSNNLLNAAPTIGLGVPQTNVEPEPSKEYTEIMQSLNKNIQPLMAKGAYEELVAGGNNLRIVFMCDDYNYTSQVTDFTLGENIYENYEDKNIVRYYYETKLKLIPTDGKAEKADTSKGAIDLIKENGQWKVRGFGIKQFPDIFKKM
jgi:hypothetical protein